MKNKTKIILLSLIFFSIAGSAQSTFTVENWQKEDNSTPGELELKVIPFGIGNEISVGQINDSGAIQFDWPKISLDSIENSSVFMEATNRVLLRRSYCEDDQIIENTQDCLVVDTQYIYLFKEDRRIGVLYPVSQEEMINNELTNIYANIVLGSTITWFYSNGTCIFKANCSQRIEWEGKYDFMKESNYDIQLKEGWNMVEHSIIEKEQWKDDLGEGNTERKDSKKTVDKVPENIKWYVKIF